MASEVVYAKVSPRERVHFTSPASETDDEITYTQVAVKCQSDPPETAHTVTCLKNPHWCYVVVALYFAAMILFITVIILTVNCKR